MLHTPPSTPSTLHSHSYLPTRPSPLSPRSANARSFYAPQHTLNPLATPCAPKYAFDITSSTHNMADENQGAGQKQHATSSDAWSFGANAKQPQHSSTYANRSIKRAPVASRDEQRERRRGLFLKRVENSRQDKRWGERSEQILYSDYLADQRRALLQREKTAPVVEPELLGSDADIEEAVFSSGGGVYGAQSGEQMDISEMERLEQMEVNEMLALANREREKGAGGEERAWEAIGKTTSQEETDYSDEEYDHIFDEWVMEDEPMDSGNQSHSQIAAVEDGGMDLS